MKWEQDNKKELFCLWLFSEKNIQLFENVVNCNKNEMTLPSIKEEKEMEKAKEVTLWRL